MIDILRPGIGTGELRPDLDLSATVEIVFARSTTGSCSTSQRFDALIDLVRRDTIAQFEGSVCYN